MLALVAILAVALTVGLLVTPYYMAAPFIGPAALAGIAILRRPVLGFYMVVLLIPFGAYRNIGGVINLPWIAAAAALAAVLLQMLLERKEMPALKSNLWPPFLLYLGISVVSALLSDYSDTSMENVFLFAAAGGYIFLGLTCLSGESWRQTLPGVVIYSVSLGSLLAVVSYFFGLSGFTEEHLSGELTRGVGGAIDPNNLCMMALFAIPLALHKAIFAPTPRVRVLMLVLVLINLMAIVTAFSRSGFLATVAEFGLLAVYYRRWIFAQKPALVGLVGMIGLASVIAVVPPSFWERQLSLLEWEDTSLSRRSSYWSVAGDAFPEAPILGAGPGAFIDIYGESSVSRQFTDDADRRRRRAHNTYIEVLIGTGLVGFGVWMWLQGRAVLNLFQAERRYRRNNHMEAANLSASYRISYLTLLLTLLTFSELYHKHMLLALAVSQVALAFAPTRPSVPDADLSAETSDDRQVSDAKPALA